MYPTFYDLVLDIFGTSIPAFKLVQSYGMMVAMGFLSGSFLMTSELKRKEKTGQLSTIFKKVWKGKKSTLSERVINGVIGFIIGFKLIALYANFESIIENPQGFILSFEGSLAGGVLGVVLAVGFLIWEDKKNGLPKPIEIEEEVHAHEHIGNIIILAAVGGILGAKLFHNLENIDDVIRDPMTALLSFSGLSFFGGFICAIGLIIWYARKNNLRILHLLDAGIPAVALGYGFGRLGCHVSGDGDWGIPNDNPMPEWLSFLPDWMWAYDYPNNVLGVDMIEYFANKGYTSLTGFAYPTPIYEIIMSVIMFTFLWSMRKRWTVPGIMVSAYLILTGTERLLIEQIRINNEYDILGGITQAEIISVAMMLMGAFGLYLMPKVGHRWAKW